MASDYSGVLPELNALFSPAYSRSVCASFDNCLRSRKRASLMTPYHVMYTSCELQKLGLFPIVRHGYRNQVACEALCSRQAGRSDEPGHT
ncbi:hypothetical protein CEXT_708181 [Caerostris extrusa]|uniref:Uncharacterized protein n=1 Tax=Caerostris extrusa TaxID=172846 RepID=A0AAV4MIK5_CAEEX|nr:hypothetical protein CEXT_708181 [Caerostris extrusa]